MKKKGLFIATVLLAGLIAGCGSTNTTSSISSVSSGSMESELKEEEDVSTESIDDSTTSSSSVITPPINYVSMVPNVREYFTDENPDTELQNTESMKKHSGYYVLYRYFNIDQYNAYCDAVLQGQFSNLQSRESDDEYGNYSFVATTQDGQYTIKVSAANNADLEALRWMEISVSLTSNFE